MTKDLKLKVAEAVQDDVNKGIVRIDFNFMRDLNVRQGDIIEIEGQRKTIAIVDRAYPSDIGLDFIRMDGLTRKNCKTGIGEAVTVKKAAVKEAKRVTIAPAREGVIIRAAPQMFKPGLLGRAVVKGDIVSVGGTRRRKSTMSGNPLFDEMFSMFDEGLLGIGFGDIKFLVVETDPKQPVFITENTELVLNPEAVELKEESTIGVTYEDIGGLQEEIKKIREMVELPLKHPEIFERLGVEPPKGVLLQGPPGTGKTLLAKAVANETNSHFILINGPEIMCVDGATKVFLNPKGHVAARKIFEDAKGRESSFKNVNVIELKKPLTTYAFDEKKDKITKAKITHVAKLFGPAIKVRLSDGNEIKGSFNQPFLTYGYGQLVWKRLAELNEGDFVARVGNLHLPEKSWIIPISSIPLIVRKNSKLGLYSRNINRSNFFKLPKKTSPELMNFLGLMWSDGCIAKRGDSVVFANNDRFLRKHFMNLVKILFSLPEEKITEMRDGRVAVYSKLLVNYLGLLGLFPGKKTERLPPYLYKLPKKEVAAFIRGYFDGNGTVSIQTVKTKTRMFKYPTPKLYAKSREFLIELQALLNVKLQIDTFLKKHPTPKGLMHALVVRGQECRKKFAVEIGSLTKQKKLDFINDVMKNNEFRNIPTPVVLLNTLKKTVKYSKYRNNDFYVYGRGVFTVHALKKLYGIMLREGQINSAVKSEHELLTRPDFVWEQIVEKQVLPSQDLYDFTVDRDNFIAGNMLLLHNSKYYGESENNIRKKFEEAEKNAPSIIFIDEIDAIATKREETKGEVERRVVAQLLALMDGLKTRGKVVVIAATNVPNLLDPALRRPGRFDRELEIGVPNKNGRLNILKIHTRNMPILGSLYAENLEKAILSKTERKQDEIKNKINKNYDKVNSLKSEIKTLEINVSDKKEEIKAIELKLKDLDERKKKADQNIAYKILETIKGLTKEFMLLTAEIKKNEEQIKDITNKTSSLLEEIQKSEKEITSLKKLRDFLIEDKQGMLQLVEEIRKLEESRRSYLSTDSRLKIIENECGEYFQKLKSFNLYEEIVDSARREGVNRDLEEMASVTHGFVGADLASLSKEAAMIVLRRVLPDLKSYAEESVPKDVLEKLILTRTDFRDALKVVRPSALREVFVEVPNVKWENIGGLESIQGELKEAVEWPLKYPDAFLRLGVKPPKGILLYGPPGTGKTLLAKAVAHESESNFISVKGPELLSKWLGDSEKAVREVFKKARQTAPTILFFDEIDSLVPNRSASSDNHVSERVVNQFLTELDGLETLHDVVIIAATNRPDILDTALLRPGRFDRIILTPGPDKKARIEIFKVHTKGMPLKQVDIDELADKTQGYVGADIESICREAAIFALREDIAAKEITTKHFEAALKKVRPSLTKEVEQFYEKIQDQFRGAHAKAMMQQEKPVYFG